MKTVCIYDDYSISSGSGVGTFLKDFAQCATQWKDTHICMIMFRTNVEEFSICMRGELEYFLFPKTFCVNVKRFVHCWNNIFQIQIILFFYLTMFLVISWCAWHATIFHCRNKFVLYMNLVGLLHCWVMLHYSGNWYLRRKKRFLSVMRG